MFAVCCQYSIYRQLLNDHYNEEGTLPSDANESVVAEQPTVVPAPLPAVLTAPSPAAPQFTIGTTDDKKDDSIFSAPNDVAAPPRYSLHKDTAATFLAGKGQDVKRDEKVELSDDTDAKGN